MLSAPIDIGPVECQSAELWDNPPVIDLHFWSRPDDSAGPPHLAGKDCVWCGEPFTPKSANQAYCGDRCFRAKEVQRLRKRAVTIGRGR